jgi:Ca2+-transporting ATPase
MSASIPNAASRKARRARLTRHGPNFPKEAEACGELSILLAQPKNPLLVILTIGAAISGWTGHWIDAAAILAIVLINAAISFWQEWNAAGTMPPLIEMAAPRATVRRDGAR